MPRVQWPLQLGQPCVQVILTLASTGQPLMRTLLADTGAGSQTSRFELILDESDSLFCGGIPYPSIRLGGAYSGMFPVYDLPVQLPTLGVAQTVRAVGAPSVPAGFDGLAAFRFLNRFTYGNFGDPRQFGLEC